MSIRVKNGKWHYRFMLAGQRVEQSTNLEATKSNETSAKNLESAHRLALIEGRAGIRKPKEIAFNMAAREWLEFSSTHAKTTGTHDARKTMMTSAVLFFGKRPVSHIDTAAINRYLTWRLRGDEHIAPVAKVTARNNRAHLHVFFEWAKQNGYCRDNPTIEAERPSAKDAVREHVVTAHEEKLYFSYAKGYLHDLGRIMILQGCRPHEVLKLRKEDVRFDLNQITVSGKTAAGQNRRLRMTPETRAILSMRADLPGPWMFPNPKDHSKHLTRLDATHARLVARLGLDGFVLYDFRHTFATRMIEAGVSLPALKDIMGHSSVNVTMRYVHLAQSHRDEAMDQYTKFIADHIPTIPNLAPLPSNPGLILDDSDQPSLTENNLLTDAAKRLT